MDENQCAAKSILVFITYLPYEAVGNNMPDSFAEFIKLPQYKVCMLPVSMFYSPASSSCGMG